MKPDTQYPEGEKFKKDDTIDWAMKYDGNMAGEFKIEMNDPDLNDKEWAKNQENVFSNKGHGGT